jgi:uridine kinase
MARSDLLAFLVSSVEAIAVPHPVRVAVDGPDAAGKTVLADELGHALAGKGRSVIRASTDSFHRPREERYRRGPLSPEGYYEDSFDIAGIHDSLLAPLGPDGDLRYRTALFDHLEDRPVLRPLLEARRDAILIFDGVFLLRPELLPHWDYAVFVDARFDVTLQRALHRDVELLGSAAEVERRSQRRYIPGQQLYYVRANPHARADVVVVNDDPSVPSWRFDDRGEHRAAASAPTVRRPSPR